jgi:hypothetical protein
MLRVLREVLRVLVRRPVPAQAIATILFLLPPLLRDLEAEAPLATLTQAEVQVLAVGIRHLTHPPLLQEDQASTLLAATVHLRAPQPRPSVRQLLLRRGSCI